MRLKLNKYFDDTGTLIKGEYKELIYPSTFNFLTVDTPNTTKFIDPKYIVIHYTAGGAMCGTVDWLSRELSRASYHFIIDRNGDICQMVSVFERAWHAGKSKWNDYSDINPYSFGIGLCNWGPLTRDASGNFYIPFINGDDIPHIDCQNVIDIKQPDPSCVFHSWEVYPSAQLFSLGVLLYMLASEFNISDLLQHSDISKSRKIDPGPAFPYEHFRLFTNIVSRH